MEEKSKIEKFIAEVNIKTINVKDNGYWLENTTRRCEELETWARKYYQDYYILIGNTDNAPEGSLRMQASKIKDAQLDNVIVSDRLILENNRAEDITLCNFIRFPKCRALEIPSNVKFQTWLGLESEYLEEFYGSDNNCKSFSYLLKHAPGLKILHCDGNPFDIRELIPYMERIQFDPVTTYRLLYERGKFKGEQNIVEQIKGLEKQKKELDGR